MGVRPGRTVRWAAAAAVIVVGAVLAILAPSAEAVVRSITL